MGSAKSLIEIAERANAAGNGRKTVAWLVLLCFFWLSYVAQTHVHNVPLPGASVSQGTSGGTAKTPSDRGSPDGLASCPLCQAVSHGSTFLLSGLAFALFAALAPEQPLWPLLQIAPTGFSGHYHQTRGPPRL